MYSPLVSIGNGPDSDKSASSWISDHWALICCRLHTGSGAECGWPITARAYIGRNVPDTHMKADKQVRRSSHRPAADTGSSHHKRVSRVDRQRNHDSGRDQGRLDLRTDSRPHDVDSRRPRYSAHTGAGRSQDLTVGHSVVERMYGGDSSYGLTVGQIISYIRTSETETPTLLGDILMHINTRQTGVDNGRYTSSITNTA